MLLRHGGLPVEARNIRSAALAPEGESGPRLFFQRVPEGKSTKNRLHLDVRAASGREGDARMTALEAGFVVMQDPEGNEFCLD